MKARATVVLLVCLLLGMAQAARGDHSVTELISTGPAGGNGAFPANYAAASEDGTRVFFQTSEQLVGADADARIDVYERAAGVTTLISTGPAGGNGSFDAFLAGISQDGARAFIGTSERLVSNDADSLSDVYERSGGMTTLVSTSPTATGSGGAFFDGASADGARVFFHTRERLTLGDTDAQTDIYERASGATTLVSTGPSGGNGGFDAFFGGNSEDGVHVFFETNETLAAGDTDAAQDVYDRSTLVSTGPPGGNGAFDSFFDGSSADGTRAFFTTAESLAATDTDAQFDVYQRASGATTLVSTGPAGGNGPTDALYDAVSADGSRVFFETEERLTAGDTDSQRDIYERAGGATTSISTGNGAFDVAFDGISTNGARAFFETDEQLTGGDTDTSTDVYERASGVTSLVSTGPAGGNGAPDVAFGGASDDGARAFFVTDEPLTGGDSDSSTDVYERAGGATTLISTAPGSGNGPFAAGFVGSSADGSRAFFETSEPLVAADTDTSLDLYSAAVNAAYARPKGATPLRVPLVPAFEPCTAPNRQHGAPLASGSCASPVQSSSALTVGSPDANGKAAQSTGFVLLQVAVGDPGPPDDADVGVSVSLTDVRRQSDLGDYAGELQAVLRARITDRSNGSGGGDPGTVTDTPFPMTVSCTPTGSTTIGSSCSLSTSFDALVPGSVTEGARAIWELDQVSITDGGADGLASTGPNAPFARQGVFVP